MENVLFMSMDTSGSMSSDSEESVAPALETRQYFIFVPESVGGKMVSWLVSDPDNEEPLFNKDMTLAFEFKNESHARRAAAAVRLAGYHCHLFGDLYE